jgi:hypothetical protein
MGQPCQLPTRTSTVSLHHLQSQRGIVSAHSYPRCARRSALRPTSRHHLLGFINASPSTTAGDAVVTEGEVHLALRTSPTRHAALLAKMAFPLSPGAWQTALLPTCKLSSTPPCSSSMFKLTPQEFALGHITPLHNSSSLCQVNSCRPITFINTDCKVLYHEAERGAERLSKAMRACNAPFGRTEHMAQLPGRETGDGLYHTQLVAAKLALSCQQGGLVMTCGGHDMRTGGHGHDMCQWVRLLLEHTLVVVRTWAAHPLVWHAEIRQKLPTLPSSLPFRCRGVSAVMMMILHQVRYGRQDNHATNHVKCAKRARQSKRW